MASSALSHALTDAAPAGFSEPELRRLFALLSIPSVSVEDSAVSDMVNAAELCAAEIEIAGGGASVVETARYPLVTGSVPASNRSGDVPRVLIYGHYDVQSADPIEDWLSPPFEPAIRGGYLYGRGTNDDKGQLFALLVAVQRLRTAGRLPVDIEFLIDGEEEIGGTSAPEYLSTHEGDLAAGVIFDAPMLGPRRPALYVASRGIVQVRVDVRTGRSDAHSGHFGGAAQNAAHVLVQILAGVLPRGGRLPPPLQQGVVSVTEEERQAWSDLPSGEELLLEAGLTPADPTAADEFYSRTTALPAVDVHTLDCGGARPKTVVASHASATLSVRLAPGQSATRIGDALRTLLLNAAPSGGGIEVHNLISANPALIDPADPLIRRAQQVVGAETGWTPRLARLGGTVPVLAALSERGVPTVLTGFHEADDATHGPNERISLDALRAASKAAAAILAATGSL